MNACFNSIQLFSLILVQNHEDDDDDDAVTVALLCA